MSIRIRAPKHPETPWGPATTLPGSRYEQRYNEHGHLETRPVSEPSVEPKTSGWQAQVMDRGMGRESWRVVDEHENWLPQTAEQALLMASAPELTRKVEELTPLLSNAIRERNKYDAECDRLEAKVEELEQELKRTNRFLDVAQSNHRQSLEQWALDEAMVAEQHALIRELGDALRHIKAHQEIVGAAMHAYSATWHIAAAAIAKLPK